MCYYLSYDTCVCVIVRNRSPLWREKNQWTEGFFFWVKKARRIHGYLYRVVPQRLVWSDHSWNLRSWQEWDRVSSKRDMEQPWGIENAGVQDGVVFGGLSNRMSGVGWGSGRGKVLQNTDRTGVSLQRMVTVVKCFPCHLLPFLEKLPVSEEENTSLPVYDGDHDHGAC